MASRAVLEFGAWTLALVTVQVLYRVARFFSGAEKVNAWQRGVKNPRDAGLWYRLYDAHINCVETLPVFLAIVVAAHISNKLAIVDALAGYILPLRIGQSLAHASGSGQVNVFIRANFFMGQVTVFGLMIFRLLQ